MDTIPSIDDLIFADTVNVAPVGADDDVATQETDVLTGDLLADNGNGADSDPNGDPLTVIAVNGEETAVGTVVTLPSGALLTINADGTFSYDPNGAFDFLVGAASGASNTTATDSFTYTIGDGKFLIEPGTFDAVIPLGSLDGTDGFRLDGAASGDASGNSVSTAGDVNGDGIDDIVIGARNANGGVGASFVVFGSSAGFDATIDLGSLDGINGFRLTTDPEDGLSSGSIATSAGDVNGDGIGDLMVRGQNSTYVVFGTTDGFDATFDLESLDGANGFEISRGSSSFASAGDVDGDGLDDLIVGQLGADNNGTDSGSSFVVFGSTAGFTATLDLASLDGTNGFRVDGAAAGDRSGSSVSAAGDVNGDGIDDFVIGASNADNDGSGFGSSYVVFGSTDGFDATSSLASLDGTNGFRIDGGSNIASAGDVNGDGFDDLIIGVTGAFNADGVQSGVSYVVFGSDDGFDTALDLADLDGTNGFRIDGLADADRFGNSVSSAGDVNGDGIDDILVGAFLADNGGGNSGSVYVVFGNADGFDAALDLAALDGSNGFRLDGRVGGDHASVVGAAGDVNGDGIDDLLVAAAEGGSGVSGESFVVFGRQNWLPSIATATVTVTVDGVDGDGDVLLGTVGADALNGGIGDDTLIGLAGADVLNGGEGNDTASYEGSAAAVTIALFNNTASGGDAAGDSFVSIENLTGSAFDDRLTGNQLANILRGGAGADALIGGAGLDTASYAGSAEAVTIALFNSTASGGDATGDTFDSIENLAGSDFDDTLTGNLLANVLDGGAGDDILTGGAGADALNGGDGEDILTGGAGADSLVGGAGIDTASYAGSTAAVTVTLLNGTASGGDAEGDSFNGIENLTGSAFDDRLAGNAAANLLDGGAGNDTLNGGIGADTLIGGDGDDTHVVDNAGDVAIEEADGGTDTVKAFVDWTLGSNFERLELLGTADIAGSGNGRDNTLLGNAGNNSLDGGNGDDTLIGGAGVDTLTGGDGRDRFVFRNGEEIDDVSGGSGDDTLDLGAITDTTQAVVIDLNAGTWTGLGGTRSVDGIDIVLGTAGADDIKASSGRDEIHGGAGNDTLRGTGSGDQLFGEDGDDTIFSGSAGTTLDGGAGNDLLDASSANKATLIGGDGDDTLIGSRNFDDLEGGAGADTIRGNGGADTAIYAGSSAGVTVSLLTGTGSGGDAEGDTLVSIENLTGSAFADTLIGDGGNNVLSGADGDDTLEGGGGNDTLEGGVGDDEMRGGLGNDVYVVGEVGDVVIEAEGEGKDEVQATISYTLRVNVENLTLAGTDDLAGTGNELANVITGNSGDNALEGGDGDDTLIGGAGADALDGGAGFDTASYAGSASAVTIALFNNTISGGDAAGDTLTSIENLTGSAFADSLTGNQFANVLTGGAGDDTLNGGSGDDTLVGGAGGDALIGGAGLDTASYVGSSAAVTVALFNGTASGGDATGDTFDGIENLTASALADSLTGNQFANVLDGGAGNDTLNGGTGDDVLIGGAGADTLIGSAGIDTASYAGSTAAVTIALFNGTASGGDAAGDTFDGIENLTGSDFADTLTGNALANVLSGGAGGDVLSGGTGDDTLVGGEGDDMLAGGVGADVIIGGAGTDTANYATSAAAVTIALFNNTASGGDAAGDSLNGIENLIGSSQADTLTGNQVANVLDGGAGNDALNGGSGDDMLIGGGGADFLIGGTGIDTASYTASAAGVTIALFNNTASGGDAQGDTFSGIENLTGSDFDDRLVGNQVANLLDGGLGSDTLTGGAGSDVFRFSSALDDGDNVDTITDFSVGVDEIWLDDQIFTALSAGALAADAFFAGTAAADASDRIVYDGTTGSLFYDADGSGAGEAIHFATLQSGLTLTADDFLVV